MLKRLLFSPTGLIFGSALLFCAQFYLPAPKLTKRSDYITPPPIIKNLSAGFQIQMSDSFWLRALQDFDFCDQPLNAQECKSESWLFHVIKMTTDLDQKFRDAYFFGAMALTVLISDYKGASIIFDAGVAQFPTDWAMNYAAGYQALYEEKNKLKASKLYYAAAENGAPKWVRVLAGRLAVEGGEHEFATQILQQMIETSQDPMLVERLKKKLSEGQ